MVGVPTDSPLTLASAFAGFFAFFSNLAAILAKRNIPKRDHFTFNKFAVKTLPHRPPPKKILDNSNNTDHHSFPRDTVGFLQEIFSPGM